MIFWLDNQENTNAVHNENYGRELLELFSMGIGNYTEDDVKDCARAFTGWTFKNADPDRQAVRPLQVGVRVPPGAARLRREGVPRRTRQLRRRPTSSTSSSSSRPRPSSSPGGSTSSSSPTSRTRRRSTSLAEVYVASGYEIRADAAGAVPVRLLPLPERLLRDGQEPGRLRGRPAAPGRGLHRSRSPASTTWPSSAATWARIC